MDSQNIEPNAHRVKPPILSLICDYCKRPKSRRGGVSAVIVGCNRFVCASCTRDLWANSYGYSAEEIAIFLSEGGAA